MQCHGFGYIWPWVQLRAATGHLASATVRDAPFPHSTAANLPNLHQPGRPCINEILLEVSYFAIWGRTTPQPECLLAFLLARLHACWHKLPGSCSVPATAAASTIKQLFCLLVLAGSTICTNGRLITCLLCHLLLCEPPPLNWGWTFCLLCTLNLSDLCDLTGHLPILYCDLIYPL